jgi:hypothetical protein
LEIAGSAVTALFIGLVWSLISVVKFFISKHKNDKETKGLTDSQSATLQKINDLHGLIKSQDEKIIQILNHVKHLDNMHSVYNDDHVPAWYVSPNIVPLVRENNTLSKVLSKNMEEHMDMIKDDQGIIVGKMSDLISSQKLMTERVGDLISALNKTPR